MRKQGKMGKADSKADRKARGSFLYSAVTWIAAVLILLTGYLSVSLVREWIPDYRGEIVTYEKTEKNSLIYLQSEESLQVYPWKGYDESKVVPMSEFISAWMERENGESSEMTSDGELAEQLGETEKIEQRWDSWLLHLSDSLVPWYGIEEMEGAFRVSTYGDRTLYLRNFTAKGGETEYQVDFSYNLADGGFSYHYSRVQGPPPSDKEISEATELLRSSIRSIQDGQVEGFYLLEFWKEEEMLEYIGMDVIETNPIVGAIYRLRWKLADGDKIDSTMLRYCYSVLDYITAQSENYDILVYQGEIMVVFTMEYGGRLILYYDPLSDEVNGISLDMSSYAS